MTLPHTSGRGCAPSSTSRQAIHLDRIVVALDQAMLRFEGTEAKSIALPHRAKGAAAGQHDDLLAILHELLAELFEALGDVHGVADHGEVHAARRADIADHHRAGMEPDAHPDRRLTSGAAHGIVLTDHAGD